jgi:hypothetical protein
MASLNPIPDAEPEERVLLLRAHHRIATAGREDGVKAVDRRALMDSASRDADPDVRAAAFEMLCDYAPDAELDRFARAEAMHVESSKVRGAVADLVAKCEADASFDWLAGQLGDISLQGALEAHILGKIAATQDPRRVALLVAWARDETKPDEARVVAVRQLGRVKDDASVRDTLSGLLESPRFRVRRAAIAALGVLRDPRTRAALEHFRAQTSVDTEKRAADDALAGLPDGS